MIPGRFGDTTDRPYVSGWLSIPRIHVSSNISFLVDTGADFSTLMPADAIKMGINHKALMKPTVVGGMGGNAKCFRETAVLAFYEPNRKLIRYYFIMLIIPKPHADIMQMPTLIGRDVLDQWHMKYDPSRGILSFVVRSADHTDKTS